MIKFKVGNIGNMNGDFKDIVVKTAIPNKIKDVVIGGGLVLLGVAHLTATAFKNGAKKGLEAETETMRDLGITEDGTHTTDHIVDY